MLIQISSTRNILMVCILLGASIILAGCGTSGESDSGHSHEGHDHNHGGLGEPRVIEGKGPEISIRVEANEVGDRVLHMNTRRIKIVNTASGQKTEGDTYLGHAHLYVDRKMEAMFYEDQYTLPPLDPGKHQISVMLSDHSHRPFQVNGELARDSVMLNVSEEQQSTATD